MSGLDMELLSVITVAEALGITVRGVRHRIKSGTLAATKLGPGTAAYVITRAEVERSKAAAAAHLGLDSRTLKTPTCWLWQGTVNENGYGILRVGGRKCRAHRVSYEIHVGPIPDGMVLDHLCRVRNCINPEHLEAVDDRTNILRGEGLAAVNSQKMECLRGHPLYGENLRYDARGGRLCRDCARHRKRADRLGMALDDYLALPSMPAPP